MKHLNITQFQKTPIVQSISLESLEQDLNNSLSGLELSSLKLSFGLEDSDSLKQKVKDFLSKVFKAIADFLRKIADSLDSSEQKKRKEEFDKLIHNSNRIKELEDTLAVLNVKLSRKAADYESKEDFIKDQAAEIERLNIKITELRGDSYKVKLLEKDKADLTKKNTELQDKLKSHVSATAIVSMSYNLSRKISVVGNTWRNDLYMLLFQEYHMVNIATDLMSDLDDAVKFFKDFNDALEKNTGFNDISIHGGTATDKYEEVLSNEHHIKEMMDKCLDSNVHEFTAKLLKATMSYEQKVLRIIDKGGDSSSVADKILEMARFADKLADNGSKEHGLNQDDIAKIRTFRKLISNTAILLQAVKRIGNQSRTLVIDIDNLINNGD